MFDKLCHAGSAWMEKLAGLALVIIMLLTGCDIVGRVFKAPIPGAFELATFAGGLIVGLAVPMSARMKEQVKIEILTERLPRFMRLGLETVTRLVGAAFLLCVSYALVQMGNDLRLSGELSAVLHLPFYYVAYAMGFAFLVVSMVLTREMIALWRSYNG
jgi:TRAP-type C4-dicarboxylate transport system permease small subunit